MTKLVLNYGISASVTVTDAYIWPEYKKINYVLTKRKGIVFLRPKRGQDGEKTRK